jgi:hypothetical protein
LKLLQRFTSKKLTFIEIFYVISLTRDFYFFHI